MCTMTNRSCFFRSRSWSFFGSFRLATLRTSNPCTEVIFVPSLFGSGGVEKDMDLMERMLT